MENADITSERLRKLRRRAERKAGHDIEALRHQPPAKKDELLHELRVHQIELEMQNEELRRAQSELDEFHRRYFDLFDLAPVGYFTINRKGLVTEANITGANLLGTTKADLIMKGFSHWIARESQDIYYLHRNQTIESGEPQTCELKLRKSDGNEFVGELISRVELDEEGNFKQLRTAVLDITEHKRAEELHASEAIFRGIFENTLIGLYRKTPDGRISMANPTLVRMLGFKSSEELVARNLEQEGFEPDYRCPQFKEQIEADGQVIGMESAWTRCDGTTLFVRESARAIRDSTGNILYYQGTVEDITECKKNQDALVESEHRFRSIFDKANDVIVLVTKFGKILKINAKVKHALGYDPDELIGKNFMTSGILSAKNAITIVKLFKEAVNADGFPHKQDLDITEVWLNHKDGRTILFEASTTAIRKDEKLEGFISILRDVTESRKAQEAYRSLVDHSLQGLAIFQKGHIVFANQAMAQITGYSVDEMLASPPEKVQAFVHPEDRKLVWSRHKKRLKGKLPPGRYEIRGIHKDGSVHWLEIDANLVEYQGKHAIQVAYLDITDLKKAEKQEQAHIRQLQYLSESANEFVKLNPGQDIYMLIAEKIKELCDGSIVAVNTYDEVSDGIRVRALEGLGKYSKAVSRIMGSNPLGRCFPLDDAAREGLGQGKLLKIPGGIYDVSPGIPKVVCQAIEKLLGLGDVYAMGLNSEGRLYGSATIFTRSNTGLQNQELIETFMNQAAVAIRRWEADAALRESEERYRSLFEGAEDHIFVMDKDFRYVMVNPSAFKAGGFTLEDVVGKGPREVFPEDSEFYLSRYRRTFETGKPVYFERELRLPDAAHWFSVKLSPIKDTEGRTIALTGISRDITEHKRAEKMLRESEERFRLVFEKAGVGMLTMNPAGRILQANPRLCALLGYTEAELLEMTLLDITYPADTEESVRQISEVQSGRRPRVDLDKRYVRKDGTTIWAHTTGVWLSDSEGKPFLGIGMIMDITERKKAEEALKESEEKYRNLFENARDAIVTFDPKGNITNANKAVDEYGFEREHFIGKSLFNYVIEGHKARATEDFKKLISGRSVRGEMDVTTPKGTFTVEYSDNPIMHGRDVVGIQAILTDITERKRAESALRESEQKYRELFENAREAIVIINMDKRITDANKFIEKYGFSKGDLIGRNYLDFVVEKYKEKAIEDFEKLRRGIPQEGEFEVFTPKGNITVDYRDNPIVRDGIVTSVQAVLTDITERKNAERALHESEEKFRNIFENSLDGIFLLDLERKKFVLHNQAFLKMLGYTKEEFKGLDIQDIHPKESLPAIFEQIGMFEKGNVGVRKDTIFKNKSGSFCFADLSPSLLTIAGKKYILVICKDITPRKKTEDRLYEYQNKLKAMTSQILQTEERERQRIAVGLHDEICQKLVFIKLALESSLKSMPDSNLLSQLRILSASIGETIDKISFLIFELSNPVLRELGFVMALKKHLAEEIQQKHKIAFKLEADEQLNIPHEEIKNSLFRITKELLTNIVKHAQAHNVNVSVHKRQNQIRIVIQDDGVGFDTAKVYSDAPGLSRFGLFSVREQLENLGGQFAIESEPHQGTKATLVVPLEKD
jgi:PAS domain S-box-containing protein